MKITVITGSPRKNGTSNYLASEFIRGALENGHDVFKFDSAKANVENCLACQNCGMGQKPCILRDNFTELKEHLLMSDVIVFVTPIYYFGMSSSLKKVIDRFYSIDPFLKQKANKGILITSQHSPVNETSNVLNLHYKSILDWLKMDNAGIINAVGIENLEQLKQTEYPKEAYLLGKSI